MTPRAATRTPFFLSDSRRSGGVRALLFALALLLSGAAHFLALLSTTHIPVSRSFRPRAHARTAPADSFELRDVRTLPDAPALDSPARFRPEDPAAFAPVQSLQQDALAQWLDTPPAFDFSPSATPESLPPELPEPQPDSFSPTDFRQEILQVERRIARQELDELPRLVRPDLPRVSGAPDISLPSDPASIAAAAAHASSLPPPPGGSPSVPLRFGNAAASPQAIDILPPESLPSAPSLEARIAEQAALLSESPADISPVTPLDPILEPSLSVYRDPADGSLFFEVSIVRSGPKSLPVLPRDVLIMQDCSESITRSKLDYFKDGIDRLLRSLSSRDRINIVAYSESPSFCFPDFAPVTPESLQAAADFTRNLRARGQTDLFSPLMHVLDLPRNPARPLIVILLTDGRPTMGTVDSSEIIARFSRLNKGAVSVFTVGAGERVNRFLLDLLAHNNRGGLWIKPLREDIPALVESAARELSAPVLANLDYRFSSDAAAEVYPAALPHLYLDRPLRLVGKCPPSTKSAALRILGVSGPDAKDVVFHLDFENAPDGGEGIRGEWAMQKIYALLNDLIDSGRADILAEIRALSQRYDVPLLYGSDFPLK